MSARKYLNNWRPVMFLDLFLDRKIKALVNLGRINPVIAIDSISGIFKVSVDSLETTVVLLYCFLIFLSNQPVP